MSPWKTFLIKLGHKTEFNCTVCGKRFAERRRGPPLIRADTCRQMQDSVCDSTLDNERSYF